MHLKNHLMDGQLHVALHLQRSQKQVIAVISQVIGGALHLILHIHNPIGHIADIHNLIRLLLKIIAIKVHGLPFIGQNNI